MLRSCGASSVDDAAVATELPGEDASASTRVGGVLDGSAGATESGANGATPGGDGAGEEQPAPIAVNHGNERTAKLLRHKKSVAP